MSEATYHEERQRDGTVRYVCLVPYATQPGGICGHWSPTLELLATHMLQQHAGIMITGDPIDLSATQAQGKPEDTPGGRPDVPPGQEDQPGNRPDVPPGHVPDEEEPHPAHPIAEPGA